MVEVLISGWTIKRPRIHYLYQKYLYMNRYRVQPSPPGGPGFAEQTELRHRDSSTAHPSLTAQAPACLQWGEILKDLHPILNTARK